MPLHVPDREREARHRLAQPVQGGRTTSAIAVANAATRTSPVSTVGVLPHPSSARSTSARIESACSSSSRPADVIETRRPRLSSTCCPSSLSSAASRCTTADGVRCSTSAAAVTVPWSASARNTRNRLTSNTRPAYFRPSLPLIGPL